MWSKSIQIRLWPQKTYLAISKFDINYMFWLAAITQMNSHRQAKEKSHRQWKLYWRPVMNLPNLSLLVKAQQKLDQRTWYKSLPLLLLSPLKSTWEKRHRKRCLYASDLYWTTSWEENTKQCHKTVTSILHLGAENTSKIRKHTIHLSIIIQQYLLKLQLNSISLFDCFWTQTILKEVKVNSSRIFPISCFAFITFYHCNLVLNEHLSFAFTHNNNVSHYN